MNEYPDDLLEDERRLADWVWELCDRYGDRLLIRVIDPQSGLGLYKCLRHWVRRYPAFIIGGRKRYIGWDREELEAVLQKAMGNQQVGGEYAAGRKRGGTSHPGVD